jgi:methyl-accepting chemotaxis protein
MFFVLVVGMFGFMTYFGVNYAILRSHSESLQRIVRQQLPALELTDEMSNTIEDLRHNATHAVLSQNFEGLGHLQESNKALTAGMQKWVQRDFPHQDDLRGIQDKYTKVYNKLDNLVQNVVAGITTMAAAQNEYKSVVTELGTLEDAIKGLKVTIDQDLQNAVSEANSNGNRGMAFGSVLLFLAVIMTIVFFWIMRSINHSLSETNHKLQQTTQSLLAMVNEAQIASSRMREAANKQSSSSTETVVSMEEMKRLLAQTSQISSNAVSLSEASFQEANDGKQIVQGLRDSMREIELSNTELEEVNQVVKLIRERTNVINEIVFKTQMLSFNANIEAARAGQHGLGFAVVANEMGSLADMSGKAAQQINELLDKSAHKVETTVLRTKEKIGNANDLSTRCYDFFKLLTDRSGQLKEFIDTISSASAEQNSGVENVVSAMSDLSTTAAESDRMAQNISHLAGGLKEEANGLATAVDSLSAFISGRLTKNEQSHPPESGGKPPSEGPRLTLVKESA